MINVRRGVLNVLDRACQLMFKYECLMTGVLLTFLRFDRAIIRDMNVSSLCVGLIDRLPFIGTNARSSS